MAFLKRPWGIATIVGLMVVLVSALLGKNSVSIQAETQTQATAQGLLFVKTQPQSWRELLQAQDIFVGEVVSIEPGDKAGQERITIRVKAEDFLKGDVRPEVVTTQPAGSLARLRVEDQVLWFLGPFDSVTGMTLPVGLKSGRFRVEPDPTGAFDEAVNEHNNVGLWTENLWKNQVSKTSIERFLRTTYANQFPAERLEHRISYILSRGYTPSNGKLPLDLLVAIVRTAQ